MDLLKTNVYILWWQEIELRNAHSANIKNTIVKKIKGI